MISFKRFLQEKYVDSRYSEWDLMAQGYIPINDWLFRDKEKYIPKTFRTSSIEGLKTLVKFQHQKKQIPTFTKGSYGVSRGAVMIAECLVELSGKSALELPLDAHTVFDRDGKRWLNPIYFPKIKDQWEITIGNEINSYFKIPSEDRMTLREIYIKVASLSKNGKRDFISWYYKLMKKMPLNDYLERAKEHLSSRDTEFKNDEIVLHDYDIKKIWFYEIPIYDKFLKENDDMNDAYFDSKYDYSNDFVKKEKKKEFDVWFKKLKSKFPKNIKVCDAFIIPNVVEKIDVSKGKYPKCK